MFNTANTVLQAIADTLQQASISTLAEQWTNIASQSQAWAYNEILSALCGRGYTLAQIANWDRGSEFELDLSIYRALKRGGALANLAADFIDSFDRRPELPRVIYTSSGIYQDPSGTAGLPNYGDADTSEDIFVLPPSGDGYNSDDFPGEGRGQVTRF